MLPGLKVSTIIGIPIGVLEGLDFITSVENESPSGTTHTFSSVNIGTAQSNRKVYVTLGIDKGTTFTISSVTIGGVTATSLVDTYNSNSNQRFAIFVADVPTGATANIVVVTSATVTFIGMNVYAYYGTVSSTAVQSTAVDATGATLTFTSVPNNGFIIAGVVGDRSLTGATYSGTLGVTTQDAAQTDGVDLVGMSSASLYPTTFSSTSKTVVLSFIPLSTNIHSGVGAILVTP